MANNKQMQFEDEDDEIEYSFELLNSDDGKLITLVCSCDKEMNPTEFAEALKQFADRIESLVTLTEAESGTVN